MIALVSSKDMYSVIPQWGPRPESAEALAGRWLALITRLETIDPMLAKRTHWEGDPWEGDPEEDPTKKGRFVPFDPRLEAQVARVIGGTTRTRDGRLFPRAGTSIWVTTDPCPRPRTFKISMYAGKDYTRNQLLGETDVYSVPDPELVTYRLFRGVLLAMAETFEATQARAYPSDLRQFWDDTRGIGPDLDLAWISYVAPRFAPLVVPPESVVVEHRPDGGLLMAATTETFSTSNPSHLAAAREIKAALVSFNDVPWTAETGK